MKPLGHHGCTHNFHQTHGPLVMDALFNSYAIPGTKSPKNDATITRKKDDATVNFRWTSIGVVITNWVLPGTNKMDYSSLF